MATTLITHRGSRFRGDDDGVEGGFTLVELMIVLAIIGLLSAAVVGALPDPRGNLRTEAERLAARTAAARDSAIIEARSTALDVRSDGYGFSRLQRGTWTPMTQRPLGSQSWGEGVVASTDTARVAFDSTGLSDPATVTLMRDGDAVSMVVGPDGSIDVR